MSVYELYLVMGMFAGLMLAVIFYLIIIISERQQRARDKRNAEYIRQILDKDLEKRGKRR